MLTYTIKTSELKNEAIELAYETQISVEDGKLTIKLTGNYNVAVGDEIMFYRNEPDDIKFIEKRKILEKNGNEIIVDGFPLVTWRLKGADFVKFYDNPNSSVQSEYLVMVLETENNCCFSNRTEEDGKNYLANKLYAGEDGMAYQPDGIKRCQGDRVQYSGMFLYTAADVIGGKYIFGNIPENTTISKIYDIGGNEIEEMNLLVPIGDNGKDVHNVVMCKVSNSNRSKCEEIAKNWRYSVFKVEDERFIKRVANAAETSEKWAMQANTKIIAAVMTLNISPMLEQNFGCEMNREDNIKNGFLAAVKDEKKNQAIDYEKQMFTATNSSGEGISEIVYNLHFRMRTGKRVPDTGEYLYTDYGDWKPEDEARWREGEEGDLLGYLGFEDEDVFYRKKKLGMSFLRLSFYDTPYRTNQTLLYSCSIYLDSGKLYEQYVRDVKEKMSINDEKGYVYTSESKLRATVSCRDRYQTKTSSEGFYLYLFPDILTESGETSEATIYMKAEFNHAKYGYTIPMIFSKGRESGYWSEEKGMVEMDELYADMYKEIPISKSEDGQYIWKLPADGEDTVTINLYEPKVN